MLTIPMPMRVWNWSSIGSYISAFGVLVFLIGVAHAFARRQPAGDNPWEQGRDNAGMDFEFTAAIPDQFTELPKVK